MINIVTSSRYRINKNKIRAETEEFMQHKDKVTTVNIVFVGRNKMKAITQQYKKEPYALPVLSFPYNNEPPSDPVLGEVVICYPLAVLLAAERNKKVDDMIMFLVKHGIENLLK